MQHFPADLSNSPAVLLCAVSGGWGRQEVVTCDASSRIPSSITITSSSHQSCDGTTTRVTVHCHPAVLLPLYSLIQQEAKSEKFIGGMDVFSFRIHHAFKVFIFMKLRKLRAIAPTFNCLSLHGNTLHGTCCVLNIDLIRPVQL